MAVTFRVDEVEPASEPPLTRSLREHLGEAALAIGGDPDRRVLAADGSHALLGAVHHAFAEHRPLALTPDAVWLTIAQGVAHHVGLNAETLRARLGVRHEGRERITVSTNTPLPDGVPGVVSALRAELATRIGDGRARLFTCDFSTTTDVDRTASEIVLLDVFSPYYDYFFSIICGIPEITLLGTVDDWRAIRARVDVLDELDLAWWTSSLRPITDRFVAAVEGKIDVEHFRGIYKPREAYGWDRITGWAARLYPYVGRTGRYTERNPLLALGIDEVPPNPSTGPWYEGPGVRLGDVPGPASRVLAEVHDVRTNTRSSVALAAGVLAVAVDDAGRLSPCVAWTIAAAGPSIHEVVEVVKRDHEWSPPDGPSPGGRAELAALFDRLGAASLFGGRLRLRPREQHDAVLMRTPAGAGFDAHLSRYIDLDDETFLAFTTGDDDAPLVVRLRADRLGPAEPQDVDWVEAYAPIPVLRTSERPDEVDVVGSSLVEILSAALNEGGVPPLPSRGRLLSSLPRSFREPRAPRPNGRVPEA